MKTKEQPVSFEIQETKQVTVPLGTLVHLVSAKVLESIGLPERAYIDPKDQKIRCQYNWSNEDFGDNPEMIKIVQAIHTIKDHVFRIQVG